MPLGGPRNRQRGGWAVTPTDLPLAGLRVLVTRPREQAEALAQRLQALGAEPVLLPTITFAPPDDWSPLDHALHRLDRYAWVIFTSVNGVRFVVERLQALGYDLQRLQKPKKAAIGPATATALRRQGLAVDFLPTRYVAEAIVEEMGDVQGQRILLPRADIARKALPHLLWARGALVDEVVAYRTLPAPLDPARLEALFRQGLDVVTFTSPSTVRPLTERPWVRQRLRESIANRELIVACIGPITARTVERAGLPVHVVAQEHTVAGLVEALTAFVEARHL
ncbi:MAG TPA: uroporphyrinogen-III synthase [Chloroflexi bacterium]|nr:uroporphyrinogen-III synthase [Chloroflexota bacterium]